MINIKDQHFNINRMLLRAVGVWPYQNSKLTQFHFICFFSIVISFIMLQFATFLTSKCTTDLIIEVFSVASSLIVTAIFYKSFCSNREIVKSLIEELQHVYADLRENEIAIMEKYGNAGKWHVIKFTMLFVCSGIIISYIQFCPDILDIILPRNESRPRRLIFMAEYFIDQERYFYFILVHACIAMLIGIVAFIATSTTLTVYFKQVCGMFKVTSYRIEHTIEIYALQNTNLQKEKLVYEGIICAVNIHRKAMQLAEHLMSSFEATYFLLIIFGVITLTFNVFRVFQILSVEHDIEDFAVPLLTTIMSIVYMFLANFVGQEVIDHSNYVFITVYQVRWYKVPVYVQKLLLFILQRGSKTFGLNIGGLFISSLHCFTSLINASLSYFTVMCSVK